MKYLKLLIVILAAGWAVAFIVSNQENLNHLLTISPLGLYLNPISSYVMPVWVGLLLVFTAGFAIAIVLDVIAWYEYERMIRLQRRQIKALQAALETRPKPAPPAKTA